MKIIAEKVICKKGEEYIEVEIEEYKNNNCQVE
jgi:hypothetical protein